MTTTEMSTSTRYMLEWAKRFNQSSEFIAGKMTDAIVTGTIIALAMIIVLNVMIGNITDLIFPAMMMAVVSFWQIHKLVDKNFTFTFLGVLILTIAAALGASINAAMSTLPVEVQVFNLIALVVAFVIASMYVFAPLSAAGWFYSQLDSTFKKRFDADCTIWLAMNESLLENVKFSHDDATELWGASVQIITKRGKPKTITFESKSLLEARYDAAMLVLRKQDRKAYTKRWRRDFLWILRYEVVAWVVGAAVIVLAYWLAMPLLIQLFAVGMSISVDSENLINGWLALLGVLVGTLPAAFYIRRKSRKSRASSSVLESGE